MIEKWVYDLFDVDSSIRARGVISSMNHYSTDIFQIKYPFVGDNIELARPPFNTKFFDDYVVIAKCDRNSRSEEIFYPIQNTTDTFKLPTIKTISYFWYMAFPLDIAIMFTLLSNEAITVNFLGTIFERIFNVYNSGAALDGAESMNIKCASDCMQILKNTLHYTGYKCNIDLSNVLSNSNDISSRYI